MVDSFSTRHRMLWSRILAVVLLAYVLVSVPPKILPPWVLELSELAGLVLLAIAAFGRLWCLVFVAGKKNRMVVQGGPYSVVRNPLYIFSFLGAVGFGLAVENPILSGILGITFIAYYRFVVKREEEFLLNTFGRDYEDYCAKVPRWIPDFTNYREPATVEVDTSRIFWGIMDAMWFIWSFLIWEFAEAVRSAVPIILST